MSKKHINNLDLGPVEAGKTCVKWRDNCCNWQKGYRIVAEDGSVTFEQCGVEVDAPEKYFELDENGEGELINPATPPACTESVDGGELGAGDSVVTGWDDKGCPITKTVPADQDTTNAGFTFSGTTITLTDSDGNSVSQDLAVGNLSVNPDDVITSLSVVNDTITIGTLAGGSFSGSITDDDTTAAGLSVIGGNIVLTDSDNNSVSLPVSDIDTDTTYTFTQSANGAVTAEAFDANGTSLGAQTFQGDADVTVIDTSTATGSPVTVTQTGTNAQGDPEYTVDYDASLTPDTSTAGAGPWRQVVEDPATGNEHVLQSGPGWRLYHDGTADMWGRGYEATGLDEAVVSLPFAISNPSDVDIVVTSYHNGPFMGGITSDVSAYEYGDVTSTEFTAGTWQNNPRGYHLFSWHLKGAIPA